VHFLLASIGVVVGIAAFAFFLALGAGVRSIVLGKIFPLDQLEVVAKTMSLDLGPLSLGMASDVLDDAAADKLRAIPGVSGVFPKMKLTVPAIGLGGKKLIGNDLRTELIVDGIDPALVAEEIGPAFHDPRPAAEPARTCKADAECGGDEFYCGQPRSGGPTKVCREYVPALVSNHLVELYNGSLRRAYDLPRLNPEFLLGFSVEMRVGASMVEASEKDTFLYERGQAWSASATRRSRSGSRCRAATSPATTCTTGRRRRPSATTRSSSRSPPRTRSRRWRRRSRTWTSRWPTAAPSRPAC
jgi:putative ABC transport system permease protein